MNSEIDNAVTSALNTLNLGAGQKQFAELRAGISENGFDVNVLRGVVRHIKANTGQWDKINVQTVLDAYETKIGAAQRVNLSCQYCHGSGWLKPVLIEGKHNGFTKVYLVNYYNPEKYFKFVKANQSFKAFAGLLPCSCECGSETKNLSIHGKELMTPEQRSRSTAFCVHVAGEAGIAAEDYYQGELIRCLNLAAEGKEYKSRRLSDYPQDIKVLQQQLSETLGEVAR